MTREECIALLNRYAEYRGMGIPNLAGCREAMKMAADLLSQSSLPSNLDEAAEEWAKPYHDKMAVVKALKAGAGWITGQGYTLEGIARPDDCEVWVNLTNTDIKDGDKVIVQIRKKQ